jgi:hypothetical protein
VGHFVAFQLGMGPVLLDGPSGTHLCCQNLIVGETQFFHGKLLISDYEKILLMNTPVCGGYLRAYFHNTQTSITATGSKSTGVIQLGYLI